jgi:predicted enzyme related to lactoylglutathione lyase
VTVLRIVADFAADDPQADAAFYQAVFGLDVAMDQGFIVTLVSDQSTQPQLSIMSEGGSGTPVPTLSIEVSNVNEVLERATLSGAEIVYPLTDEHWNVRRFFLRDPSGRIINVLQHTE